ncbi:MAG: homoserine O-acetyltransferase [Victivallaceae bacterium]|nr:homoserine O-acetyltransferase [Victivallaceae bacterium]
MLLVAPQNYTFDSPLELDCGRRLKEVNLRFETVGTLSPNRDNAVLVTHALSGDAHVCGFHSTDDSKPGWWDEMVGPGKYLDTNRYFVICANVPGGCSGSTGPRSIDPDTGKPYNLNFPVITIRDMVRAEKRLIDHLGIGRLLAVVGGSMGGMQAMEWSIMYPEAVAGIIPIATTCQLSPQSIAFDWVGREAIEYDPNWKSGDYDAEHTPDRGLATARMLAHITYLSDESMSRKFGRELQDKDTYSFNFRRDFAVESYLEHQGQRFVERFDANSYFYITRAMDYFDMAEPYGGDLARAFSAAKSDFLVVSFTSDWLFPSSESRKIVKALLANKIKVSFSEITSGYGHDAFLLEVDALGRLIRDFLSNLSEKEHANNG